MSSLLRLFSKLVDYNFSLTSQLAAEGEHNISSVIEQVTSITRQGQIQNSKEYKIKKIKLYHKVLSLKQYGKANYCKESPKREYESKKTPKARTPNFFLQT